MKVLFIAHSLLIDCGKASKQTKGLFSGPLTEASPVPFHYYNQ